MTPSRETDEDRDIAGAARIAGVAATASERAQMRAGLARQRARADAVRGLALPRDLPPSLRFDPRPPGFGMPPARPPAPLPEPGALPASEDELLRTSAWRQAAWLARGLVSARALASLHLDRIARANPTLLAYARVTAAEALDQADRLDAHRAETGAVVGPLHGLPYGLKDIVDTAGIVTDWGAEPYRGRVPDADAHVTSRLREAGAVLLGKTAVGALAYGDLWYGGRTRNPWNIEEGSSGSSAGSASAVAASLASFAIGTETLGSILAPAARCRCVGLRPTHGRVSRRGVMPLCPSLDKIGVLARDPLDAALVLSVIAAKDDADPAQIAAPAPLPPALPQGVRLGLRDEDLEPASRADLSALASRIGAILVELPPRPALPWDSLVSILDAEAAASFEDLTFSDRDDLLAWQDEQAWPNSFRRARFLSAVDHIQLDRLRGLAMRQVAEDFAAVDLIAASPGRGPTLVLGNFTGTPALNLPGFGADSARSLVVLGPLFDEALLLAFGIAAGLR